ncbi:nuclease HARBI1 [Labeo rohita]|uniref:Nuclease HARBI1 n=1 Tax=Labeo rohita TaxID=84645 RepID=A0A498P400_LABRO|nr:nuclease HARBI1 [Labeo rohita]
MEDQFVAFGVALLYLRRRRRRSVWVHEILQARQQLGEYHRLVQELRLDDDRFQRYFRLDREQFDNLLSKVGPRIARQDTSYRHAIEPAERLAICLRCGRSMKILYLIKYKAPIPHYKKFSDTMVDAQYCFRVVDVGSYGRTSDGGVMANSTFGQALRNGTLGLPQDALLPGAEHLGPQPHVFVADEAFPLRRDLMRPFPGQKLSSRQRIFNYRLSRARLIVENAFGILTAQWRMYRGVIEISPANVDACVKATCVLHNFLRRSTNSTRTPIPSAGDGEAAGLQEVTRVGSNNATREAIRVRENFMTYFSTEGAVPWQPVA